MNESQISSFLGRYTPAVEAQLREARTRLHASFPRGFELVYDNYNALVFGISPTERTSEAFLSIAGYPKWVTLFFLHGADLRDPHRLLAGTGKQVRSIRLKDSADIDTPEVRALIAQAMKPCKAALLAAPTLTTIVKSVSARQRPRRPASDARVSKPVLLSGGNPQIAKADGDAPVKDYISAMPGWKRDVGRRLDELITTTVPNVHKGVRWNSPMYGIKGQGWFASFHVFTKYVKLTFFRGTSLEPVPPGGTVNEARWIDIHEVDLDEPLLARWFRQAASIPGWGKFSRSGTRIQR